MFTKKTTLLLLKILEKITADKKIHSLWLNTLSYLEYIGARKILKSLPASILNKTFLQHIQEESRHSLFFKKLAENMAQKTLSFKKNELLASKSASNYFQQIDHYTLNFNPSHPVISYLYTTYVVEQRAMVVYSLYHEMLKRKGFSLSLQSVLNDEKDHLEYVFGKIKKTDPLWEKHLEDINHFEHQKYFSFLIALETEVLDKPYIHPFSPLQNKISSAAVAHQNSL